MLKKLSEICDIEKGRQIDTKLLDEKFPYKYINGGIKESGYFSEHNTQGKTVIVSEGGASCGYVNYIEEPFWCGCHCYRLTNAKVNEKYLYYVLKGNQDKIMKLRTGAAMPNIKKSSFANMILNITEEKSEQNTIVNDLDYINRAVIEFTKLKNMSIKEIEYKLLSKGINKNLIDDLGSPNGT